MKTTLTWVYVGLLASGLALAGCQACGEGTSLKDDTGSGDMTRDTRADTENGMQTRKGDMVTAGLALPTGRKATSVLLIEKMGPETVSAGQEFTYRIKATNLTDMALSDVKINEELPADFTLVSTSPKAKRDDGDLVWMIDSLPGGASRTMEITGKSKGTGMLIGCTNATYKPNELCLSMKSVQPKLEITLIGPSEEIICDPVTYRIMVSNPGTGTAKDVRLTGDLPKGLKLMDGSTKLSHSVGDLAAGESKEMTIKARADRVGEYEMQAMAMADGDLSAESDTFTTAVKTPVLVVSQEAPEKRYVNRPMEYTITIRNDGDIASTDTMLEQKLPSGVDFVSASNDGSHDGDTVSWRIGKLDPGQKRTVTVRVRARDKGSLEARAMASAYCADTSDADARTMTRIEGIPAILLEMVDESDPIELGNAVTYRVRITNQGSKEDTNIVLKAEIPAEQEFISADGPSKFDRDGRTVTFKPLKTLDVDQEAVYKIRVRAKKEGNVRFKIEITSDQLTKPVMENESTNLYK